MGMTDYEYIRYKNVDGVAVVNFLETVSMFEGDKVKGSFRRADRPGRIKALTRKYSSPDLSNAQNSVSSTRCWPTWSSCTARFKRSKAKSDFVACAR